MILNVLQSLNRSQPKMYPTIDLFFYLHVDDAEKTLRVTGQLLFDPTIPSSLAKGSCVIITIQEDIQCQREPCENPVLGETTINDPKLNGNNKYVQYKVKFKPGSQPTAQYLVQATLNMGWCKNDGMSDGWIRDGDFHSDISHTFSISPGSNEATKDVALTSYDSTDDNDFETGKASTYFIRIFHFVVLDFSREQKDIDELYLDIFSTHKVEVLCIQACLLDNHSVSRSLLLL